MLSHITIARPYAKAAFDFAVKNKVTKKWENMLLLANKLTHFREMKIVLLGVLGPYVSGKIFVDICREHIDNFFVNFIQVIAEHKRLFLFSKILKLFYEYQDIYNNTIKIKVISSKKLKECDLNKINSILNKKTLKKVYLEQKINKSLIHGIIIKKKDMVIDNTILNHLKQLERFLRT